MGRTNDKGRWVVPRVGHEKPARGWPSQGRVGQVKDFTPYPVRAWEMDGLPAGLADVGVVEEPVRARGGQGLGPTPTPGVLRDPAAPSWSLDTTSEGKADTTIDTKPALFSAVDGRRPVPVTKRRC